jgi:hypothetical protein
MYEARREFPPVFPELNTKKNVSISWGNGWNSRNKLQKRRSKGKIIVLK